MNKRMFWLGLVMQIISYGKQISSAVESYLSNTTTATRRVTTVSILSQSSDSDILKGSLYICKLSTDYVYEILSLMRNPKILSILNCLRNSWINKYKLNRSTSRINLKQFLQIKKAIE